jgi:hypothetical protein
LQFIKAGRFHEALDELDLYVNALQTLLLYRGKREIWLTLTIAHASPRYLPQFPFQENPTLHSYAAMLKLYLGQNPNTGEANPLKDDRRMKSHHHSKCNPDRDPT